MCWETKRCDQHKQSVVHVDGHSVIHTIVDQNIFPVLEQSCILKGHFKSCAIEENCMRYFVVMWPIDPRLCSTHVVSCVRDIRPFNQVVTNPVMTVSLYVICVTFIACLPSFAWYPEWRGSCHVTWYTPWHRGISSQYYGLFMVMSHYSDVLKQERSNPSAKSLELRLSCIHQTI